MKTPKLYNGLLKNDIYFFSSLFSNPNRFFFFIAALILNTLLIQNLEYTVIAILFFLFGWCITKFLYNNSLHNLYAFELSFSLFLFGSIVSNFYLYFLNDISQIDGDAGTYFREAAGVTNQITKIFFVGAIYFYQKIYDFFAFFGFEKNIYIGTLTNTTIASLSVVYAVKSLNVIFPIKRNLCFRLVLLLCVSGNILLFSTTHLRDILIFLLINITFYLCINILYEKSSWLKFGFFLSKIFIISILILVLRSEYVLLPFIIVAIVCLSKAVVKKDSFYLVLIAAPSIVLILIFWNDLSSRITHAASYYSALKSARDNSGDSLFLRYIESQPAPLRGAMGLYALVYYPIPIFAGKTFNDIYDFLKSANGVYNYILAPAFLACLLRFGKHNELIKPAIFFSSMFVLTVGLAVVFTSGESRHFGVFLLPFLFPIVLADWSQKGLKILYLQLFMCSFFLIYAIHLAWGQLKLF